jgi:hypothetical protein
MEAATRDQEIGHRSLRSFVESAIAAARSSIKTKVQYALGATARIIDR